MKESGGLINNASVSSSKTDGFEEQNREISVLDITDPKYRFTERGLSMVFILMMLNTMAVNIDHGAIP